MKYISLLTLILAISFSSCKEDPENEETIMVVEFKAKMNGENLVIKNNEYINISGYKVKFEALRFYLSNLKLIAADNSEVLLKDVEYLDFTNNHNSDSEKGEQVIAIAKTGDYKGIKFAIGVDPSLNNGDPSVYPEEHPLSIYTGEHWGWNTGYIFFKLEGRFDTTGTASTLTDFFLFHIGTNQLYLEKEFTKSFSAEGDTTRLRVILDADKLFYSATDTIDLATDPNTQTTDNFPLAERMKNTLSEALSIE